MWQVREGAKGVIFCAECGHKEPMKTSDAVRNSSEYAAENPEYSPCARSWNAARSS